MSLIRKILVLSALLLIVPQTQAQEYKKMIDEGTASVEEIITAAKTYFATHDTGKGSGYFPYKRWEYNALRLMDENGYLPSVVEQQQRLQAHNAYLNETANTREPLNDNWTELGPDNWNATTAWSPGVGRITGIAIDKNNENHLIIGANTGGVWKSTNAGQNWMPMCDNFSNMKVYSVAMHPQNSNIYFFGSNSGLIFKSEDAGATWNQLADISNSLINKIVIHPTNPNMIFACSENAGIFRSTDGGATWNNVTTDTNAYDVEFNPTDTDMVYASGKKFQVSTDGGATFFTTSGFGNGAKMIGVSPDNPSLVYVLEEFEGSFGGFYVSNNMGTSFTKLNHAGRNYFGYDTNGFDSGGQAPRDMDIAVNPANANEVHIAGVLTWRSTNGGTNFSITSDWIPNDAANANIGYCHADVDILEYYNTSLYVGTDGGIFKATNPQSLSANYYTDLTQGLGIRQFYKIGVSQTQAVVVTGGSQDNGSSFYTENNGWRDWIGADGMEGFVDKTNPAIMYGAIQFGRMYRTDNAANNITGLNNPGPGGGNWVSPFEQDPIATNTIYIGYDRFYKSTNKGVSWTPISQQFPSDMDHLKIAQSNNQIMYAARLFQMFKTTDGGATNWNSITNPSGYINSIAIHPTNPDKIAVATTNNNRVFVSNDGGTTWQNYKKNLPDFSALALVWDDNGANGLYLGMDYGIFYIDDTQTDWQPYSNNLPNVIINELEINNTTNTLYAGSYGRGLWATPLVTPVLDVSEFISESDVVLYPNPATDNITISVKKATTLDIRVFDVLGKLVIFKSDEENNETVSLNIAKLKAGTYFIRINSDQGTVTKKLLKK